MQKKISIFWNHCFDAILFSPIYGIVIFDMKPNGEWSDREKHGETFNGRLDILKGIERLDNVPINTVSIYTTDKLEKPEKKYSRNVVFYLFP